MPPVKEQLKTWAPPGLNDTLRGAFLATRAETGDRSVSDLVTRAVEREVARLARKHHGGQPFDPVPAGVVPTGRPSGS